MTEQERRRTAAVADQLQAQLAKKCEAIAQRLRTSRARLRVAITLSGDPEIFLFEPEGTCDEDAFAYNADDTTRAVDTLLGEENGTVEEFLSNIAAAVADKTMPGIPATPIWDEPCLVICGVPDATAEQWLKKRQAER